MKNNLSCKLDVYQFFHISYKIKKKNHSKKMNSGATKYKQVHRITTFISYSNYPIVSTEARTRLTIKD